MATRKPKSARDSHVGTLQTRSKDVVRVGGERLRDGLKALEEARGEVVEGQSRLFKLLLGLDPSVGPAETNVAYRRISGSDPFVLPTLEGFLDGRVAESLNRLGVPGVAALEARLSQIEERLARLEQALPRSNPSPHARRR
jgi:hypothetical protein